MYTPDLPEPPTDQFIKMCPSVPNDQNVTTWHNFLIFLISLLLIKSSLTLKCKQITFQYKYQNHWLVLTKKSRPKILYYTLRNRNCGHFKHCIISNRSKSFIQVAHVVFKVDLQLNYISDYIMQHINAIHTHKNQPCLFNFMSSKSMGNFFVKENS